MGIVERKIREKEKRIQEILNAARVLFINKGYGNTTMLDIAEESELSRRTIYLYFKSKEELSSRVMTEAYELLFDKLNDAMNNCNGNAYDKIVAMKEAYMDFYKNDFNQLIFILLFDLKFNPGEMEEIEVLNCMRPIQSIVAILVKIMKEGQSDGSLLPHQDPVKSAYTFMTMIQSTIQKLAVRKDWLQEQFNIDDREIMEEMFRILFNSIRPV
jgi:AcrR family transcriptional regulator